MAYLYSKHQSSFLWLNFSRRALVILERVLFVLLVLTLSEDASPPVFLTIMFMIWHVFINSEDLASAPSSSTWKNETLLSWFLNVATQNFRMSRGGCFLLDGYTKGYEVAEHIATKVEVNPRMISTLKKKNTFEALTQGKFLIHQWLDIWEF